MAELFEKLIKERQACRSFSVKPIERELIYEIVDAARFAPSACNSQPWRVYITCTPTENAKMRNCLQDDAKNAFLDDAQAFIAVYKGENVTLNKGTEKRFPSSHFIEYDAGEFIAYMTLVAKDKGIDSCIIGWVNGDKLNETFSLSGKCDIVVALGYAKEDNIRTKNRKSLRDVIINYEEVK